MPSPSSPPAAASDEGSGPNPRPSSPPKGRKKEKRPRKKVRITPNTIKETRGELMLALSIGGERRKDIARLFGVSSDTVLKEMTDATRSATFQLARDFIGSRLLPQVLFNLEALLETGDKETTLLMAKEMGLIGTGGTKHIAPWGAPAAPADSGEETLETFRLELTRRIEQTGSSQSAPQVYQLPVVEAVEVAPAAGPEGAVAPPGEGDVADAQLSRSGGWRDALLPFDASGD